MASILNGVLCADGLEVGGEVNGVRITLELEGVAEGDDEAGTGEGSVESLGSKRLEVWIEGDDSTYTFGQILKTCAVENGGATIGVTHQVVLFTFKVGTQQFPHLLLILEVVQHFQNSP